MTDKVGKVKIEDTVVFRQVAAVIGERNAKLELFKASKSWDKRDLEIISKGGLLEQAFCWLSTDQETEFWLNINQGYNPYK